MNQKNLYPDPTRNKKYFYWKPTYDFMVDFLNKNNELKIGCEVGVAGGQNIKHILKNCSHIQKIFGVDSYSEISWDMQDIDIDKEFKGFDGLFNEVNSMLSQFGERVKLIRKFSVEACKEFEDKSLDFVFIDAGHEFDDCYNDIINWYPKVKENGLIIGHDWYHPAWPGVTQSVMKIFKTEDIQYFKAPVHVWFVKKKTKDMNGIEKFKKKLLFYLNHPKLLGFF
jgi:SAM-dependent methyltransferase